jgi:hypothetical protein
MVDLSAIKRFHQGNTPQTERLRYDVTNATRWQQPNGKPRGDIMSNTKGYNGHKNWNHWNVSLWINNDEGLNSLAKYCIRIAPNKDMAAKYMLQDLRAGVAMPGEVRGDNPKTPDGAPYTVSSIRAAMVGM